MSNTDVKGGSNVEWMYSLNFQCHSRCRAFCMFVKYRQFSYMMKLLSGIFMNAQICVVNFESLKTAEESMVTKVNKDKKLTKNKITSSRY